MRKLLIALGALTLLAGCTAQASIPNAKNAAPQSQAFNFPKASCGDKPTGGNDTWYPVFVDGGNLETIHRNFCADAISTVRKDSKVQTIQVASFTNRDKAIEFAKAVGGNVGQLTDVGSSERQPQSAAGSDEAILTANDPDSQISLHDSPSLTGKDLGYGVVGDRVIVISQTTVEGYPWYQVRFPRSGAIGWIRGDFVSVASASRGSSGLGITRSDVQSRFEAVGFNFKDSPLSDGRSRTEGQMGTSSIELIGSPNNLEEATLVILPSSNQSQNEINAVYTYALAEIVSPNWIGKDDWLINNTKPSEGEASTVQNGQLITLRISKPFGVPVVLLNIKPAQP
jgi:hypothetical protein